MSIATSNPTQKRYVVFVPDDLSGGASLAQRIHFMAARDGADVLYIALAADETRMLSAERMLATLTALTRSERVAVQSRALSPSGWLDAAARLVQAGDALVCLAGHEVADLFFHRTAVNDLLAGRFPANARMVLTDGGLSLKRIKTWSLQALWWLGCAALIATFSLLEYQADHALSGLARVVVLGSLLTAEVGLVVAAGSISR